MNKLLQTIKENDDGFEKQGFTSSCECGRIDDLDKSTIKEIKSHITQSRIKELEALVEMVKGLKQFCGDDEPSERKIGVAIYNQALSDIIQIIKDTIKQLKTN